MNFRRRLENSDWLAAILSSLVTAFLRFGHATSRKTVLGLDELSRDLEQGPVMLVIWHGDLAGVPAVWPFKVGGLASIHDTSPAGRVGAETYTRLGVKTFQINAKKNSQTQSRQIIKTLRDGSSLGMAADGPNGPARVVGRATLDWARTSGCPIWLFTWTAKRRLTLGSWDSLKLPLPFSRSVFVFRKWEQTVPRRLSEQEHLALSADLAADLDLLNQKVGQNV